MRIAYRSTRGRATRKAVQGPRKVRDTVGDAEAVDPRQRDGGMPPLRQGLPWSCLCEIYVAAAHPDPPGVPENDALTELLIDFRGPRK
jgi:hypothetical protein